MLNNNVFYHGTIRKTIVAFGHTFSNIFIDRRSGNSVTGDVAQRLQVPIAYGPKEKWLVRLEQDPNLENNVYTTLPRMAFEITSLSYDETRKLNRMNKITCNTGEGASSMFTPVPISIDISLYILTKTQEDALQIVEQILPTFGPDYTISINAIPTMNLIQDIPLALSSSSMQDDYEGDFNTRRFVTWTLTFTLKLNLYGPVRDSKVIYHVAANLSTHPDGTLPFATYTANGDPITYEIVDESWLEGF